MSPGFLIYRYDGKHYSADEEADFTENLNGKSGIQILSDNFIDDLDREDYLTLLPEETEPSSRLIRRSFCVRHSSISARCFFV